MEIICFKDENDSLQLSFYMIQGILHHHKTSLSFSMCPYTGYSKGFFTEEKLKRKRSRVTLAQFVPRKCSTETSADSTEELTSQTLYKAV